MGDYYFIAYEITHDLQEAIGLVDGYFKENRDRKLMDFLEYLRENSIVHDRPQLPLEEETGEDDLWVDDLLRKYYQLRHADFMWKTKEI